MAALQKLFFSSDRSLSNGCLSQLEVGSSMFCAGLKSPDNDLSNSLFVYENT